MESKLNELKDNYHLGKHEKDFSFNDANFLKLENTTNPYELIANSTTFIMSPVRKSTNKLSSTSKKFPRSSSSSKKQKLKKVDNFVVPIKMSSLGNSNGRSTPLFGNTKTSNKGNLQKAIRTYCTSSVKFRTKLRTHFEDAFTNPVTPKLPRLRKF